MAFSKNNPKRNPQMRDPKKRSKRRHGKRTLHHVLLILILLIAGIALSLTVFFKIESISIYGNEHYDNDELIAKTGLNIGENLFLADTSSIPEKLKGAFPYIEDVTVKRSLPPSIKIELTSSIPIAALEQGDEFSLITKSGKILEQGLVLIPSDVILVEGVDFRDYKPGDYLGSYTPDDIPEDATDSLTEQIETRNAQAKSDAEKEEEALSIINYLLEATKKAEFSGISNLDLTDPLNMTVVFENRMLLKLGTEYELVYKLKFIKEVVAQLDPEAKGIINAENAKQSSKVIYTPAEGFSPDGVPISPSKEEEVFIRDEDELESQAEEGSKSSPSSNAPAPPTVEQPPQTQTSPEAESSPSDSIDVNPSFDTNKSSQNNNRTDDELDGDVNTPSRSQDDIVD